MRSRSVFGATFLILIPLFLTACGATSEDSAPSATVVDTKTISPTAANSATPSPTLSPTPVVPAEHTFRTPDGSLSFTYPANWSVAAVTDQPNSYAVTDDTGNERVTLRDRVETLPVLSVTAGIDTGFRAAAPGVSGPTGQGVTVMVQGTFGQAVGSQAAVFALANDGTNEPIGRAAVEVPAGGYYVMFGGMIPLETPTNPPSDAELLASATAFADSPSFAETSKVMASLTLHPDKVQVVGCLGAKYKYLKLDGISCNDAKATLDRVEKTGTGTGARNMETTDYLCFYASFGDKQTGQADVTCYNKSNPQVPAFEAWVK